MCLRSWKQFLSNEINEMAEQEWIFPFLTGHILAF